MPRPPLQMGVVDTTKARPDPQRVRMSSGERPIGAAKGKQSNREALCHPPPPLKGAPPMCIIVHHARTSAVVIPHTSRP